eukprot:6141385-Amphidinium_carterae.1
MLYSSKRPCAQLPTTKVQFVLHRSRKGAQIGLEFLSRVQVHSREGRRAKREPPQASCVRLLCEEVSGDVLGLAPLLKLQTLDLLGTQVRRA